ncbi:MAG: GTP pyrophosphokinase family protein [Lachnospiraceae bacterium]
MPEFEYQELIVPYKDALNNLRVRLEILNNDYRKKNRNYPIHYIQTRIKKKKSLENKLMKKGLPVTAEAAADNIRDIAGIRVICYFVEDIYAVAELLKQQQDLIFIRERDYVKKPKSTGYESYHIIFGVPVYHIDGMEYFPVEIQIRTMSMDFWASMEHRICYKNECSNREELQQCFYEFSRELKRIESSMQHNLQTEDKSE